MVRHKTLNYSWAMNCSYVPARGMDAGTSSTFRRLTAIVVLNNNIFLSSNHLFGRRFSRLTSSGMFIAAPAARRDLGRGKSRVSSEKQGL